MSRVTRSGQEPLTHSTQIIESQSQLGRVEVTGAYLIPTRSTVCKYLLVLRAHNVPHIKAFGVKREYFVTIIDGATTKKTMKKTKSIQIVGDTAVWDQRLDAL